MANARSIDGKAVSERRRAALKDVVDGLSAKGVQPLLAAVTVQPDQAWAMYQRNQATACAAVGIAYRAVTLPDGGDDEDLAELIETLNVDPSVHGIILQNPFPAQLTLLRAQAQLSPDKDVEGVSPANLGLLLAGRQALAPCTALSAVALANEVLPDLTGVEAVVVGASVIVGKPIAQLLTAAGATVTLCHVHTRDLAAHTRRAELLIVAVGKPGLITAAHVRAGAVVIDVGINRVSANDGKTSIVGDVAAEVATVAGALSPVPGGVGSLTTTILLESTVAAAERLAQARPALDAQALGRLLGDTGLNLGGAAVERIATLLARHLVNVPTAGVRRSALERRLADGPFVLDGAMGTELIARGVAAAAVTQANLDHPDLVSAVHRAYVDAGAQALTANTFGANRLRAGSRDAAVRLATAGVQLARQAAAGRVPVLGSIGPLGPMVGAELSVSAAEDAFAEIALVMADAHVDGFIVETMSATVEAAAALAGIKRVSRLPVLVCRTSERPEPADLAEFARAMEQGGAAALGINCAAGPRALAPVVGLLASLTTLPVIARPNAGFPTMADGRAHYHLRPTYLLDQARDYLARGVSVIGGCCGVGPDHIRALADGLRGATVGARASGPLVLPTAVASVTPHPLLAAAAAGHFPVLALVPGRLSAPAADAALTRLAAAGADAVGLLTGWPGANRGPRLVAQIRHVQDVTGKAGVLELLTSDTTLARIQDKLLTAHLLGLRLVLIDAGVFSGATRADALSVDVDPVQVVTTIARLNAGRDLAGSHLQEATGFAIGVRLRADDLSRVPALIAAGAQFLTVQPVYAPAQFRAVMSELANVGVPLFAEVMPLPDAATADELDNELPALSVPERLKQRLRENPNEDVAGVVRFLGHWRTRLAGVCVLATDERTGPAETVIRALVR